MKWMFLDMHSFIGIPLGAENGYVNEQTRKYREAKLSIVGGEGVKQATVSVKDNNCCWYSGYFFVLGAQWGAY